MTASPPQVTESHESSGAIRNVYDVVVVGAGILGLATARELLRRNPWIRLLVVDKESGLAAHQTGHNSGVLHSGLYYQPGSLKARLCREGKESLERYAEENGIPVVRCGKFVIAGDQSELPALEELRRRGDANGVPGIEMLGPDGLKGIEPHAVGPRHSGLLLPPLSIIAWWRQRWQPTFARPEEISIWVWN